MAERTQDDLAALFARFFADNKPQAQQHDVYTAIDGVSDDKVRSALALAGLTSGQDNTTFITAARDYNKGTLRAQTDKSIALEAQTDELQTDIYTANDRIDAAEKGLALSTKQAQDAQSLAAMTRTALEQETAAHKIDTAKLAEVSKALATAQSSNTDLQGQIAALKAQVTTLTADNQRLVSDVADGAVSASGSKDMTGAGRPEVIASNGEAPASATVVNGVRPEVVADNGRELIANKIDVGAIETAIKEKKVTDASQQKVLRMQMVMNQIGMGEALKEDAMMGPKTRTAIAALSDGTKISGLSQADLDVVKQSAADLGTVAFVRPQNKNIAQLTDNVQQAVAKLDTPDATQTAAVPDKAVHDKDAAQEPNGAAPQTPPVKTEKVAQR